MYSSRTATLQLQSGISRYQVVRLLPNKHSNSATGNYQFVNLLPGTWMILTNTWWNSKIVILNAAAK